MFAYTFNNICANFAHFGRMKVKVSTTEEFFNGRTLALIKI